MSLSSQQILDLVKAETSEVMNEVSEMIMNPINEFFRGSLDNPTQKINDFILYMQQEPAPGRIGSGGGFQGSAAAVKEYLSQETIDESFLKGLSERLEIFGSRSYRFPKAYFDSSRTLWVYGPQLGERVSEALDAEGSPRGKWLAETWEQSGTMTLLMAARRGGGWTVTGVSWLLRDLKEQSSEVRSLKSQNSSLMKSCEAADSAWSGRCEAAESRALQAEEENKKLRLDLVARSAQLDSALSSLQTLASKVTSDTGVVETGGHDKTATGVGSGVDTFINESSAPNPVCTRRPRAAPKEEEDVGEGSHASWVEELWDY